MLGGEIWWECLSNGSFVFHLKVYRDCQGIPYYIDDKTIDIIGNPLPKDASNNAINSITLRFDSSYWDSSLGDLSPRCSETGLNTFSCANEDNGAYQEFTFTSDQIWLRGVPPANGWEFYYVFPCCRPNVYNLATTGTQMIKAVMFPDANSSNVIICNNSSPKFAEGLDYLACSGQRKTINFNVNDVERDSISYHFDRTYNTPPFAPHPVPFRPGYGLESPTPDPDSVLDSRNEAAILSSNGLMSFRSFLPSSSFPLDYYTVIRVDEWRNGSRLSSTFREFPILLFDCSTAPINSLISLTLNANSDTLSLLTNNNLDQVSIRAGSRLVLDVNRDSLNLDSTTSKEVFISSNQFSRSENDPNLCDAPPCARLIPSSSAVDFEFDSVNYRYRSDSLAGFLASIDWQTDCNHLGLNNSTKKYFFEIQYQFASCTDTNYVYHDLEVEVSSLIDKSAIDLCLKWDETDSIDHLSWDINNPTDSLLNWKIYRSENSSPYTRIATLTDFSMSNLSLRNTDSTSKYYMTASYASCGNIEELVASDTTHRFDFDFTYANNRVTVDDTVASYKWYRCLYDSNYTVLSTEQFYNPIDTAHVALELSYGNCKDTSDCIFIFFIGLNENTPKSNFELYPNPSNGLIYIKNFENGPLNLQVYDLSGRQLLDESVENENDAIQLPDQKGIYLLRITDVKGNTSFEKVVRN